jgi:hypothetical protein
MWSPTRWRRRLAVACLATMAAWLVATVMYAWPA